MPRRRASRDATAELCECYHEKHSHERDRETLKWSGQCRAFIVEIRDGQRFPEHCKCTGFNALKKIGGAAK